MEKHDIVKKLSNKYEKVIKVCRHKNGQLYEGVPLDENWKTFEDFLKDNWIRYCRALIKWRNYKRVSPRKEYKGELKVNPIFFVRKIKELGYTKENTVFTSISDSMKYSDKRHRYVIEDKLMGTRDIKNMLRKNGVDINMESITKRLRNKEELFSPKKKFYVMYKGKHRSFAEISKIENISKDVLKKRYKKHRDIKKAIQSTKNIKPFKTYLFEGKNIRAFELADLLSKKEGINKSTLLNRIKKHGSDISKLCKKIK